MKPERERQSAEFAEKAVEHYGERLHSFLARRMHNPQDQDVKDLVQEVCLQLLKANHTALVRNPVAYILTTAAHVAERFGKRDQRARRYVCVDSELMEFAAENPAELPADQMARRLSTQRQLNAALVQLPAIYQLVLLRFYRDGLSYVEIGKELKLSIHQVERYLAHAKEQLMAIDWEWD
jgi:RNA polymerase sigma factor (sigma-70 family)